MSNSVLACKLKNSFAIDSNQKLYSWGSHETALLGQKSESDFDKPTKLEINEVYGNFNIESISVGHFHAACVSNLQGGDAEPKSNKYVALQMNKFLYWYENQFIPSLVSPLAFIKAMLRLSDHDSKNLRLIWLEELLLKPFYEFQKLNKRDIFNINETYDAKIKKLFEPNHDGVQLKQPHFELAKLETSPELDIKEIYNFAAYCFHRIRMNPEDFPFFVSLVMRFQTYITSEDIYRLLDYYNTEGTDEEERKVDQQLMQKCLEIYVDLETENGVLLNTFIDFINGKKNSVGRVFTWGVFSECRLGYPSDQTSTDDVVYQYTPKMVRFKNIFTRVEKVACGYAHTLCLTDKRQVYSWGSAKYGCLGNTKSDNVVLPELIEKDFDNNLFKDITDIAAGMYFSVALESDGNLYTWGNGSNGRLGHDNCNSVSNPKMVQYFKTNNFKIMKIAVGDTHIAVLTTGRELFTWGNGSFGKLGHGNFDDLCRPTLVEFFLKKKIEVIVAGSHNTLVIFADYRIWAFGKNSHGMLSVPNCVDKNILIPQEIIIPNNETSAQISTVALGTMHSIFLLSDGTIYSCGNSLSGILGISDVYDKAITVKKVEGYKFYATQQIDIFENTQFRIYTTDFSLKIDRTKYSTAMINVACSSLNTAFITNTGEVYMCGENTLICNEKKHVANSGQSKETNNETDKGEIKSEQKVISEYKIIELTNPQIKGKASFIALGRHHVICVANEKAYSWGTNFFGSLGLPTFNIGDFVGVPTYIDKVLGNVRMAAVSDSHSLILCSNGEIWAFGSNLHGKLGIGDLSKYWENKDTEALKEPTEVDPQLVKNITFSQYIACSNSHSACIMKFNAKNVPTYSVYTWGSNYVGKLGFSEGVNSYEPKLVEGFSTKDYTIFIVKVCCADEFTIVLDIDGNLWGWGKRKYVTLKNHDVRDDGVTGLVNCNSDFKFKYVSASHSYVVAIDVSGDIYHWGKIFINDKFEFQKFEKLYCPKMNLAVGGGNSFCSVEDKSISPFTWGYNQFFKCGQQFESNAKPSDEIKYYHFPKKIEFFYDYFINKKEQIEKENPKNGEAKGKESQVVTNKDNAIQLKILDETFEDKNKGILNQDIKINKKFYETIREYFEQVRLVDSLRKRETIAIENKIISMINKAKSRKNDVYRSEVPKIISQNFQIYETFITILQTHPCYLKNVSCFLPNNAAFIEIVKMVFGRNRINLNNRRVILMLMGLWNAVFKDDTTNEDNNLLDTTRYEDFITYDLYDLIFKINKENTQIIYELACQMFLYFITEIYKQKNNSSGIKDEILSTYKDLGEDKKKKICEGALRIIKSRILNLFSEITGSKSNFSFSVVWMLKCISDVFKSDEETESNNEKEKKFCKLFNYFVFVPFTQLLKKIRDAYDENLCQEYSIMQKNLPEVLEKVKNNEAFTQLYNYYNTNKKELEVYFKKICAPKSDILKQIYDIFIALSRSDYSNLEIFSAQSENEMFDMNIKCKKKLIEYQYDFTLSVLRDQIKGCSEDTKDSVIIPMTIKDIIYLQTCFLKLLSGNIVTPIEGPFKEILNILNDFKLEDLDNNSNIRNFVVNFYIQPNTFFMNTNIPELRIIKCYDCLLPVVDIFFNKETAKEKINGKEWKCCDKLNDPATVQCAKKTCGKLKTKECIKENQSFFKLFTIPHEEEIILLFEEVLLNLHVISETDDITKEIDEAKNRLLNAKNIDNAMIEMFKKFQDKLAKKVGICEDSNLQEERNNQVIKDLFDKVKINLEARLSHRSYLKNIGEFLNYVMKIADAAKTNIVSNQQKNKSFVDKLRFGYSNDFAKDSAPLFKLFKDVEKVGSNENPTIIKKYITAELIKKKIIDDILFHNQPQPKLIQKSYILVEKTDKGCSLKLNYKEKNRKYIICGITNHEFILEDHSLSNEQILYLRTNSRNNPTINLGDIRFNVFYLINLLNSLETD